MRHLALVLLLLAVGCGDNVVKSAGGDAGMDEQVCGNGAVEGTEECDAGSDNGAQGGPCDSVCQWVCKIDGKCDDLEACNGVETCADHRCVAGTDEVDGTTCGTGQLCRNAACTDAVCGDGFVTGPDEECDDANAVAGDGCETSCKFSCVSTDQARNCTPADVCAGQGACNDSTHTCIPGTPLANDTACDVGGYCKNSVCTQPMCGNGTVEPGEVCDHGTANGMPNDGCKVDCTFACVNAATDCTTAAPACQMKACNASHVCAPIADPSLQGMTCGSGSNVCNNGACVPPTSVCGNAVVETGEQCDLGSGFNGPGTGCETSCQFSCTTSPNSCTDGNSCNGAETCGAVTVNGHPGRKCSAGTAPPLGTSCGTNQICLSQVCVASTCGDNFVDSGTGETCEPPNSATCDGACHTIVCGDGVRAGGEQCDDGNTTNLDGCDGTCNFEQCHRVNTLSMAFNTDAYCTANALGGAIKSLAQGPIGTALTDGVKNGQITIQLKAIGLDDLSGTNDPSLTLGILTGTPVTGTNYDGASDLDWWYTTSVGVIDTQRVPTTQTPASIAAKNLTAGPADISITISLGGSPATLNMLNAKLKGNIGAASTPLTSSAGSTPGHLAAEHLNPALQSFGTMTAGQLCGNVTAGSLAAVPIPSALLSPCSQYTAANSLLDVIVGGCSVILTVIAPTQPDKTRSGTGTGKYTLQANPSTKIVTGCKDQSNANVPLPTCLQNAAYSSSFKFTTDRVIAK